MLFNAIVQILEEICRRTGLSYFEINILIYTFFVPSTWWLVVWLRTRRHGWLGVLHLLPAVFYLLKRDDLADFSEKFYEKNVHALLHLGGGTDEGYVQISIFIGVVVPFVFWLLLFFLPKKWLLAAYSIFLFLNFGWYFWALT